VFVLFPGAHFDSDQAVFGLMANDLIDGIAIPSFAYGRRYMLSVGVWLAAPLFAIWGSSVFLLKLPILALNLACVAMLWAGFRSEGLSRTGTSIAILPFAASGVVTSSRIVEHAGGNIEPLAAVIAAYFLRKRPVLLGFGIGIAFLNREFALIGFLALLTLDVIEGKVRARFKARLTSAAVIAVTVFGVRELATHLTRFEGPSPSLSSPGIAGIVGFFQQQLPNLLGGLEVPLRTYNLTSALHAGHTFVWVLALGWLALCVALLRIRRHELPGFSSYLVLAGGAQAVAFMLFVSTPSDPMLLRYVLLCLLAVVGLVALAWQDRRLRIPTAAVVIVIALANLSDHARLAMEYTDEVPARDNDLIAKSLLDHGIRYAYADYWIAYDVTFITQGRVLATPDYDDRIPHMRREAEAHVHESIYVRKLPCDPSRELDRVAGYYLCWR
jgi:hypothetical protein